MNIASSTGGNSSLALTGVGTPTTSVDDVEMLNGLSVSPNPSTSAVVIRSRQVIRSVDIINAVGQTIATIDGVQSTTEVRWNGMTSGGDLAPAGAYTAVVRGVEGSSSIQVAIVR